MENTQDNTTTSQSDKKIIVDNISLIETKIKKERNGSLYDLFSSEYFNINYLLNYLIKRNEISVIDTLVSILRKNFTHDSFFYLPQLW